MNEHTATFTAGIDYPADQVKRPSIIDEYAETIGRLDSTIAELTSRLGPVLRLNEPRPATDGPERRSAASTAREILYSLDGQHQRLRELLDLLEV